MTDINAVSKLSNQVISEVERAIVGKRDLLELVMAAALAGGHVLLEDYPGLGKTLIARSFATALGLDFKRIQYVGIQVEGDGRVRALQRQHLVDGAGRTAQLEAVGMLLVS